ncbi:hypothetical protein H4R33_003462 [Dimargaris cristalligena]|nr:hypothetical protein H4R33_003462 [Dimargaris cristalligena]
MKVIVATPLVLASLLAVASAGPYDSNHYGSTSNIDSDLFPSAGNSGGYVGYQSQIGGNRIPTSSYSAGFQERGNGDEFSVRSNSATNLGGLTSNRYLDEETEESAFGDDEYDSSFYQPSSQYDAGDLESGSRYGGSKKPNYGSNSYDF